jgi:outer membrane protein
MKNIALILMFIVIAKTASAQTSAGNMMLGGNVSFYNSTRQGSNEYQQGEFIFSPNFGYFISDNLAVGAALSVGTTTFDNGVSKTVRTTFGAGPLARYYKFTSNDRFAFFGQGQFLFNTGKEDITPGGENKIGSISFSLSPGFSYFFTDHWAVDLLISGFVFSSYDPNKDSDNDKTNNVSFNLSLSPSIGMKYHF